MLKVGYSLGAPVGAMEVEGAAEGTSDLVGVPEGMEEGALLGA